MVLLRYELATIAIPKALSVTNSSAVPSPFRSHPVIMKSLADIWQGVQAVRGAFPAGFVYELNPKCRFVSRRGERFCTQSERCPTINRMSTMFLSSREGCGIP